MQFNSVLLNITSEDPPRMAEFYTKVLKLKPNPVIGEGAFDLNDGTVLLIDGHSETKGKSKEPHRMLINFSVPDLKSEQSRLKGEGVQFIREEGSRAPRGPCRTPPPEEWGGVISTFLDPDGNYLQLIEFNPS